MKNAEHAALNVSVEKFFNMLNICPYVMVSVNIDKYRSVSVVADAFGTLCTFDWLCTFD